MQKKLYAPRDGFRNLAVALLVIGCSLYGFSLDRYPGFYVDDAFFAFPALKAALGGSFTYAVNSAAPFANEVWAYHGPLFPHLLSFLFRVFGFSPAVSRLPDFLGGWMAALLIVIFLNRRGYRYAGLAFAILWCGDRAPQELMYGRMDGLALLFLVLTFLSLEHAWRETNATSALLVCGIFCGLACLTNPLCLSFAAISFLLAAYSMRQKGALWFSIGYILNLPLLLALWHFKIRESVAQFLWHARMLQGETLSHSIYVLVSVLKWSRYWFISLVIFSFACMIVAVIRLLRKGKPKDESGVIFLLATAFGLAAFGVMFRASTHPYYIVYFSVWPMLCFVMLVESYWKQFRYVAITMSLIWCTSAAWNVMRIREPIIFHSQLSKKFLYVELRKDVPLGAEIYTIPVLYSVPIEAGYSRYNLTTWFPEQQDICPACYLLITASEFHEPHYIAPANIRQRQVVYNGPAFPGAGPLAYPIVVLSPEVQTAN